MNMIKIGRFLQELRKEKGITQEQMAEELGVSGRTISRWETGSNMPDIGMLIEIADFYEVSIPEIIDGERKNENMNQETKDTAIKLAEYSKNEAKIGKQRVTGYLMSVFGIFIIISALAIRLMPIHSVSMRAMIMVTMPGFSTSRSRVTITRRGIPFAISSILCIIISTLPP